MFHDYRKHSSQSPPEPTGTPVAYSKVLSTPTGYDHLEYYYGKYSISHFLKRSLEIAIVLELVAWTYIPISATQ
jgi:hypothetical protein